MITKRILAVLGAAGATLVILPMFAAFEAHVVNVTATIENALSVDTHPINYGTVFPQEQLNKFLKVAFSDSFQKESRVDDVEYIIRQKPKCAWTINNGQQIVGETQSGEVDSNGQITCPKPGESPTQGAVWGPLPLLCNYLSKHEVTEDGTEKENDTSLPAFHQIGYVNDNGTPTDPSDDKWIWNDATGRLSKVAQDADDNWDLDLKVPCFGGYCAQDWASFVHGINPDADPNQYTQPIANEHKVFGCDVWIEVTQVSEQRSE